MVVLKSRVVSVCVCVCVEGGKNILNTPPLSLQSPPSSSVAAPGPGP